MILVNKYLVLLALFCVVEVQAITVTSFNMPDFSAASQNNAGGLTFNGAATSDGTLNTNTNLQAAGNFFFDHQINATSLTSFSAFYGVSYDTSNCFFEDCNDGVALILQTVGLNFYSSSTTWSIPEETGSFAVAFQNHPDGIQYVVDGGNANEGTSFTYVYLYRTIDNLYTWVDYNHGTLQLDIYLAFVNNKTLSTLISYSGVNIFGSGDLNLPSLGTYYVGLGASTGFQAATDGVTNEGHKVISMWFNTCSDASAPCGSPTPTATPTPTVFTGSLVSFSGPITVANPSELKTCRIVESFGLLTGYFLTASGSPVCCTQTGLISGPDCEISACGSPVSSLSSQNYATSDSIICFADTVCYTQGSDNPNADAIPVYNGAALSGTYSLTATGPKKTSVFIQKPSGAVSAAFQITPGTKKRDALASEYGCVVKGSYSGGSCSQTLCGASYPIGGYSDYFYDENGNCYANCIGST